MTDIKDLLTRAVDVPIAVDAHRDLRRGRARLRRHRLQVTGAVAGGALALGALAVAGHATLPGADRHQGSSSFAGSPSGSANSQQTQQQRDEAASLRAQQQADARLLQRGRREYEARLAAQRERAAQRAARPHRSVDAAVVDPSTLVHTPFYDVPPAPEGWHLVGAQPEYVMIALDGTDPSLTGDFLGKLMVLHGLQEPQDTGTPIDFDGRTFYSRQESGVHSVSVSMASGDWLSVQWPETAEFEVADMVAFLDAVQPLAGAVGAS